jgi:hypothetical protein
LPGSRPEKRGVKQGGQSGPQEGTGSDVRDKGVSGLSAVQILRSLAENTEANAMSRTSAARALAEIEGQLGRHAPPPVRDTSDIASLSRGELVQELERLRAVAKAGPEA